MSGDRSLSDHTDLKINFRRLTSSTRFLSYRYSYYLSIRYPNVTVAIAFLRLLSQFIEHDAVWHIHLHWSTIHDHRVVLHIQAEEGHGIGLMV